MTETCTVRPELIEFNKATVSATKKDKQYLTIVAHNHGFKFTETESATNTIGEIDDGLIPYDNANLADLFANDMYMQDLYVENVSNVESITMLDTNGLIQMNQSDITNVGTISTGVDDSLGQKPISMFSTTIDMNETGDIHNTNELTFWKSMKQAMEIRNDEIIFGNNEGRLDMNKGHISNVDTLSLYDSDSVVDINGGKIENVHRQMMSEDSRLEFANGGELRMSADDCLANIGVMTMSGSVIENRNDSTTGVDVELTNFLGNVIKTSEIDALDGTTLTVFDALFTEDKMLVANLDVNRIEALGDVEEANANLYLKPRGEGTVDVEGHRISSVANPVDGRDAANKSYVNEAVSNNIQGLKPKKACDYAIFGNQWTNKIRTQRFAKEDTQLSNPYPYFISHEPSYDEIVGDTSTMVIHYTLPSAGNVAFSGYVVENADTVFNEANVSENNPTVPNINRKRIMINGLSANVGAEGDVGFVQGNYRPLDGANFNAAAGSGNIPLGAIEKDDANVSGLNGIWEILSYDSNSIEIDSTTYTRLYLVRARDMNQNKEMMNNAYSYLMNGTDVDDTNGALANFGYVVNNKDPITIEKSTGYTLGEDGNVTGLEWIRFNQVNFEMDFLDTEGKRLEDLDAVSTFNKGAILMRNTNTQASEKEIMADWNMINYDVVENIFNLEGNIELTSATGTMSAIKVKKADGSGDAGVLDLNGMTIGAEDGDSTLRVDDIIANTVTCESDKTLKKNIEVLSDGVEMIDKLKPVTYNWKKDAECKYPEYGFIAQDVLGVFPSLVQKNSESGILSVDYMKITSLLAAAVQELHQEVKDLKGKMSS